MDKKIKTIGAFIIASAIIWGVVIVGSAAALKGTECYGKIQNILVGGVVSHLILIWGPMGILLRRNKENKSEDGVKE
jgi:hypothetical protein